MRPSISLFLMATFALLAIPSDASAQWGPLMEKLQQLSGPAMQNWTFPNFWFGPYESWQRLSARDEQDVESFAARRDEFRTAESQACFVRIDRRLRPPADQRIDENVVNEVRAIVRNRARVLEGDEACDLASQIDALESRTNPARGFLFRAGFAYGEDRLGSGVWAATLRLSAEYRFQFLQNEVGVEAGFWPQRFAGGDIDPFFHLPVTGLFNFYPFAGCRSPALRHFRAGYGAALYYPFEANDFAPAYPDLDESWELIRIWTLGFDITLKSFKHMEFWDLFRCD